MIYLINAYKPDTLALYITTARVHELDPQAVIFIASDPAAPVYGCIPGAQVIMPRYPHGGNLRGAACVQGLLQTMDILLNAHNARHIVKLDADTYLNSIAWMQEGQYKDEVRGGEPDFIAMERNTPFSENGDCYRVSKFGVRAALKGLERRIRAAEAHGKPAEDLPEDVSIANLIMQAQLPVYRMPFFCGQHRGLSFRYPDADFAKAAVIHCGEPLSDGSRAPREMVYLRLQTMWRLTHTDAPIPGPEPEKGRS